MKNAIGTFLPRLSLIFVTALALTACSSVVTLPEKEELPELPDYVKVPHPAGFDLADLKAIFFSPLAPKGVLGEFADTCDEDFQKLAGATKSPGERRMGAVELVKTDPERMHWCFYAKIMKLQENLQGDSTWSARQNKVLQTFAFLSPVANAYSDVYHDSRYLRWATQYYTKISEWVFFKKVVPTPDNSLMLVKGARSQLEPWVPVEKNKTDDDSVFAKYGITLQPSVAGTKTPYDDAGENARAPASIEETPASPNAPEPNLN